MYFELFKLRNWRKRSAEVRRHNCAVLPKISDILKRTDCDRRESPEGGHVGRWPPRNDMRVTIASAGTISSVTR